MAIACIQKPMAMHKRNGNKTEKLRRRVRLRKIPAAPATADSVLRPGRDRVEHDIPHNEEYGHRVHRGQQR